MGWVITRGARAAAQLGAGTIRPHCPGGPRPPVKHTWVLLYRLETLRTAAHTTVEQASVGSTHSQRRQYHALVGSRCWRRPACAQCILPLTPSHSQS